jgi:hypothetical protein
VAHGQFKKIYFALPLTSPFSQAAMIFAIPWSLGACTDPNGREKLDEYVRALLSGKNEELPVPKAVGKIDVMMPENGLIYDYMYEVGLIFFCLRTFFHSFGFIAKSSRCLASLE